MLVTPAVAMMAVMWGEGGGPWLRRGGQGAGVAPCWASRPCLQRLGGPRGVGVGTAAFVPLRLGSVPSGLGGVTAGRKQHSGILACFLARRHAGPSGWPATGCVPSASTPCDGARARGRWAGTADPQLSHQKATRAGGTPKCDDASPTPPWLSLPAPPPPPCSAKQEARAPASLCVLATPRLSPCLGSPPCPETSRGGPTPARRGEALKDAVARGEAAADFPAPSAVPQGCWGCVGRAGALPTRLRCSPAT